MARAAGSLARRFNRRWTRYDAGAQNSHRLSCGCGGGWLYCPEGDGILPELAAQQEFTDLKYSPPVKVENQVRSLFLYEPDETAVLQNMRRRGRGFEDFSPEEQRQQARAAWLYGLWLHDEAQKNSLSVGAWETLTKRVLTFANDSSTLNGESCSTTDIEQ